MKSIIIPIADELEYSVQRADQMSGSNIMTDIIAMLKESDIVISDLTDLNPNVFYELGLRQANKGKCINIVSDDWLSEFEKSGHKMPFDITYYRAHRYKSGAYENANNFRKFIKKRIKNLENQPCDPCIKLTDDDMMTMYGTTVVTDFRKGTKNHYRLAKELFSEPCKSITLIGKITAIIVQNLGKDQTSFQITGTNAKMYLKECIEFYNSCEYVYWNEIVDLYSKYKEVEKKNL